MWLAGIFVVVVVAISVALSIVARRFEPYVRARIVQGLEQRFHTHVELDQFHVQVNNIRKGEWGLWAAGQGLRIWPPKPVNGEQALDTSAETGSGEPLISLNEFSFHLPLRLDQTREIHIGEVRLKGLHIRVPPRVKKTEPEAKPSAGMQKKQAAADNGPDVKATPVVTANTGPETEAKTEPGAKKKLPPMVAERVVCEDADLVLETNKPGKMPMHFPIPHLTLTHVTPGGAMGYVADVLNPKPMGLVHAEGHFGPWVTQDPGMSDLDGTYHMDKADMGVFKGIAGLITSDGKFSGTLRAIAITGTANVPDFRLVHFGTPMPLMTRFDARVDGTDGDTWLDKVDATLGHSQFQTWGKVVRIRLDANGDAASAQNGKVVMDGHVIDLDVNVPHGQMEDFLKLTSKNGTALLTGIVSTKAHLLIPPGHEHVEHRMKLDGTFDLSGARFTSDAIQGKIEQLSLRGQGKPGELKTADPTQVRSEMKGTFHMANAAIALPQLEYLVPGADIQLKGSYWLDGTLDFDGSARMDATVSQMLGGWKGLLLKPADRFFKKDGAGTLVPITIKGTREAPKFSLDFKRMGIKGTKPERPDTNQTYPASPATKQP